MNLGTAQIIRANSRNLPLADDSVDLVVTSPPYFALRSYQDGGAHYAGQIGDEPTPAEFVDSLIEVTRECVRVLKPSGSLWVNLGDKYSGAQAQNTLARKGDDSAATWRQTDPKRIKSLCGIPWRYALRCIDDLGLILRAEVIWSKPNGLPESVTDRVRRSHEQWFHFTLNPRYFSAVDEIREAHAVPLHRPGNKAGSAKAVGPQDRGGHSQWEEAAQAREWGNPLGKLPGSVWTVPTEPLRVPDHLGVDHFAAFPTEWPKRIIQGWSPAGVCCECREGRRPVVERNEAAVVEVHRNDAAEHRKVSSSSALRVNGADYYRLRDEQARRLTGYACACPEPTAPTTPAVVLDPFGGTGTTAMVAKALGRHGISVDMSADYCRLAQWRVNDRDQLAKVLGLAKVDPVAADEQSLLDLLEGGAA